VQTELLSNNLGRFKVTSNTVQMISGTYNSANHLTNTHDTWPRKQHHKSTPFSGTSFRTVCISSENFWLQK